MCFDFLNIFNQVLSPLRLTHRCTLGAHWVHIAPNVHLDIGCTLSAHWVHIAPNVHLHLFLLAVVRTCLQASEAETKRIHSVLKMVDTGKDEIISRENPALAALPRPKMFERRKQMVKRLASQSLTLSQSSQESIASPPEGSPLSSEDGDQFAIVPYIERRPASPRPPKKDDFALVPAKRRRRMLTQVSGLLCFASC